MDNLDIFRPINTELLNPKHYFQSIIEQAQLLGLVSAKDILEIQKELLLILAEQTDKWSRGDSTSIPTEKAQDIMTSVVFVIGIQLKSYQSPEQAIEQLKAEPLKLLFEHGLKLVNNKMTITKRLQKRVVNNLLDTLNVFYHSTLIDGINGFFKMYSPQFTAHEIHITVDYPTFIDRPNLDGIEFIEQYLRCIEIENSFCVCFTPQDIHHLLCGLIEDYINVPMNIFEPVFLSALGLSLLNHHPLKLNLTKDNIHCLYQLFLNRTDDEIQTYIKKAFGLMYKKMKLPLKLREYTLLCIPKLTKIIQTAVLMKTLDKVFLIPSYPIHKSKIIFSYEDSMNDKKYQTLIENISQTDDGKEKINLILNEAQTLGDFLDILSDVELDANDMESLVNLLPITVFVSLLAQYPNDDFLERENDRLLFVALEKRKLRLFFKENKQIEQAINALYKEDI